ncbi:MAG: polysaccharide biosynthesis/export family protein, partial [Muribaculaceae bacterium]|nr:polysaccharide biosynthesis/export family protein [Muribaculaceae bacterium]
MKSRLVIMMIAAATLLSCTSTKDNTLAYFRDLEQPSGSLPNPQSDYSIRVQPDDELVISVTSVVPEATAAYNVPMDNPATRSSIRAQTQPRTQTYIVDDQGYIMFPVLGRLKVAGKTMNQIAEEISA